MISDVEVCGNNKRPAWNYNSQPSGKWPGAEHATVQMIESVRNTLEAIHASQMLQCDVAHAIKDIAKTLRRIDRRLAKVEGAKL